MRTTRAATRSAVPAARPVFQAFAFAGAENRHAALVAWNTGRDAGTGGGSLMLGVAAHVATFSAGFVTLSCLMAAASPAVLLIGHRPPAHPPQDRRRSTPGARRPSLGER